MKKLLLILGLLAVSMYAWKWAHGDTSLSLVQVEFKNPNPPSSPLYPASQEFVAGVNADPKLRSRFAGTFTKSGLYSEMRTALKRGAQSLDGPVEVNDAPIKPLDESELRSALNNLGSQYQGEFAKRFSAAMQSRATASDEDLCWAGKTLLHGITLMDGRDREVLSRWGIAGK